MPQLRADRPARGAALVYPLPALEAEPRYWLARRVEQEDVGARGVAYRRADQAVSRPVHLVLAEEQAGGEFADAVCPVSGIDQPIGVGPDQLQPVEALSRSPAQQVIGPSGPDHRDAPEVLEAVIQEGVRFVASAVDHRGVGVRLRPEGAKQGDAQPVNAE